MHKKMVGDEDDGDEDHDKDGSYKTPPQQQQQHLNQSKLTALVCGCGNHFLLDLGAGGVLQSTVST